MTSPRFYGEDATVIRLLEPAPLPVPAPGAFMLCPCQLNVGQIGESGASPIVELYRLAYQQAQALLSPPRHERCFSASMN